MVGILRVGADARNIGLRADMGTLPITEATELPYASETPGAMHTCGHDGHTAILPSGSAKFSIVRRYGALPVGRRRSPSASRFSDV